MCFLDPPGQPGTPDIDDVDEDSVTLSWDKPKKDGGDKVKGYVIEMKPVGESKWTPVNAKFPCKDNKMTINDLDTNKDYEFRVVAKNRAGLGKPSDPSQTVTTKPKASMYTEPIIEPVKVGYISWYW